MKYICNCLFTDSHPTITKVQDTPIITKLNVNKASVQFSSLIRTVEAVLDKSSDNLELCKRLCIDFTISDNCDTLLFNDEQLQKIEQCKTFRELFKLLRQYWNWREYYILKEIISESNSKEARDELEKYEKIMSSYAGLQLISDNFLPEELPNDYVKMIIIIEKPYKELTLKECGEIRDFIIKHMDVKPYIAHPFIKFLFSSLHLEWFVLHHAIPHLAKMARKNMHVFAERSIFYIQIGKEVVLDTNKVCIIVYVGCRYIAYSSICTLPVNSICDQILENHPYGCI